MDQKAVNPTPKIRFQEIKGAVEAHHGLIETESFKRACDVALLEYNRKLAANLGLSPVQGAQFEAMANAWRLQGANEFLAELRMLGEKQPEAKPPGLARVLDHSN
jgi:hypothetical protein